jgi:iron complex outermembrane recepter protein
MEPSPAAASESRFTLQRKLYYADSQIEDGIRICPQNVAIGEETMKKYQQYLSVAASVIALSCSPALAQQSAPTDKSDSGVADIIVTAQRRAENLQNVNIAATAISGEDLSSRAVVRQLDLQNIAPGITITKSGLTESVNIRGIGIASGSPQVANGVASYLDGVFQPPVVSTGSFYDIATIEILRGPQGTLVGSNSTGGAVFINTNKPKLGELGGSVNLGYGSFRNLNANAAVNLPLGETLAVRISGLSATRDSYYTDIGTSNNKPDSLSEQDIRGQILWKPGNFSAHYKAELIHRNSGGYAYQPILTTSFSALRSPVRYQLNYNTPTANVENAFINSMELKYETDGGLVVRALGAFQNKRISNLWDNDANAVATAGQRQHVRERQTSGEINIISPSDHAFSFILGGYYQRNKIDIQIVNFNSATLVQTQWIEPNVDKVTTGAFAQANYKVSDQFEIQAGVRYSHFTVDGTGGVFVGRGPSGLNLPGINVSPQTGHHADGRMTGKVAINWKPNEDNLIYVFAARGYKPGGINPPTPPGAEFQPETVTDYEAGWKASFFDRRIKTQIGVFYNDYSNFQQQILNLNSGRQGVTNVPTATIKGFEAQVQAKFGGLLIDGGLAYTDTKLGASSLVNTRNIPGFNPNSALPQCTATLLLPNCFNYTPFIQNTTGGPSLYAPKWTWNLGAEYAIPVGDGRLTPRIQYSYVGSQFTNLLYNPVTDQLASHGLLSAQIAYVTGPLRLEVYGTNLTKEYYVSGQTGNNEFYGAPREFGARLGFKF